MKIIFTDHAKVKFNMLKKHGFEINEKQIIDIIEKHDVRRKGKKDRFIVQSNVDDTYVK
jgi:hypothetical protein